MHIFLRNDLSHQNSQSNRVHAKCHMQKTEKKSHHIRFVFCITLFKSLMIKINAYHINRFIYIKGLILTDRFKQNKMPKINLNSPPSQMNNLKILQISLIVNTALFPTSGCNKTSLTIQSYDIRHVPYKHLWDVHLWDQQVHSTSKTSRLEGFIAHVLVPDITEHFQRVHVQYGFGSKQRINMGKCQVVIMVFLVLHCMSAVQISFKYSVQGSYIHQKETL